MRAAATYKTTAIAAILLLMSSYLAAQQNNLDSVKSLNAAAESLLNTNPDSAYNLAGVALELARDAGLRSAEAVSYKYMGLSQRAMHQPDSALSCFFMSLDLFTSLEGKEKGQINALNNISETYIDLGAYDKALKYASDAASKSEESGLFKEAAISFNQIGEILLSTGVYPEALKNYYSALQFSIKAQYARGEANALANLGKTYTQIGNFEMAERFLMQAYDKYLKDDGQDGTGRVLTNLANLHLLKGEFDRAVSEYSEALQIKVRRNDEPGIALAFNNLGYAWLMKGIGDSAMPYFDKSLELRRKTRDLKGQASTLNNIAAVHISKGRLAQAESALGLSISICRKVNAREYLMEALKLLADLNEKKGHKLESLEYHKEYSTLQNELYGVQNNHKVAVLQAQFEMQEKEKQLLEAENTAKQLRLSQERLRKRLLIAGLLGSLAILLIIAYRYTIVQRLLKLVKIKEHQKEQLLKELNHRVKNNLQIMGSILRIQSRRLKDDEALRAIMEGQKRIEAMALVHKQLYSDSDSTEIELSPFIQRLLDNLSTINNHSQIRIEDKLGEVKVDAGKAMLIGLIINELVSNAFKHNMSDNPQCRVVSEKFGDGSLLLSISDNGPGLDPKFEINENSGFGLKLVRSFTEKLGAKFTIDPAGGNLFTIHIP